MAPITRTHSHASHATTRAPAAAGAAGAPKGAPEAGGRTVDDRGQAGLGAATLDGGGAAAPSGPTAAIAGAAGGSDVAAVLAQVAKLLDGIGTMLARLGMGPGATRAGGATAPELPASAQLGGGPGAGATAASFRQGPVEPDSTATDGPLRKVPGGAPASSAELARLAPEIGSQVASDNADGSTVTSGILDDVKGGNRATAQAGLARAIEVAKRAHPDGKVGEVDLEPAPGGGRSIYKVDVGTDEVWVDPDSFTVIKVAPAEK